MELSDLTREDWYALLGALSAQVAAHRQHAAIKEGSRQAEVTGWADHCQELHDRCMAEFRARDLRGEVNGNPPAVTTRGG